MEKKFEEVIKEESNIVDVDFTPSEEVTEEAVEGEVKQDQPNWMSFIVGVRGDAIYECKSNIDPTTLTDYIEASAGIDMNVAVNILKTNGIEAVETFFKMKEILVLNSVRLMQDQLDNLDITTEQYDQLRNFFGIDRIEAMLEQRRNEMVDAEESPQEI